MSIRRLLFVLPLVLALSLVLFRVWTEVGAGTRFDAYHFFVVENLEFSITVVIVVIESLVAFVLLMLEAQRKLAGRWEVQFVPCNWKGKRDAVPLRGEGRMYLARSHYSESDFVGYMHVRYWGPQRRVVHRGIYQMHLDLHRKRAQGWSQMEWGEDIGQVEGVQDSDTPYVNTCHYDLAYDERAERLSGQARMERGPTECRFVAYRE